ncbi:MAG: DUF5602 domain-containing protein [Pyrinomonadaceae bacterium]
MTALLSLAAGIATAAERTLHGSVRTVGNGKMRSWVKVDDEKLTAIGVTFTEDALKGLPPEPPPGAEGHEYVFEIPEVGKGSPFKHILVNWNPYGHPPAKVYDVGHFDFHFYLISDSERMAITAVGEDAARSNKPLPAELTPKGYVLAPDSAIPRMGSHWADVSSHEFHGSQFTKTFLFGSYDGKLIFLEPMITKAYLETRPNVVDDIKLPAKLPVPGYYPTKYRVAYDAAKKEYTVALEATELR